MLGEEFISDLSFAFVPDSSRVRRAGKHRRCNLHFHRQFPSTISIDNSRRLAAGVPSMNRGLKMAEL